MSGKKKNTVAIIGLGLLGMSLGLSLKGKGWRRVAWARRAETRALALKAGAAEEVCETPEAPLSEADISVICLPIPVILSFCREHASSFKTGSVVTDIGSVKAPVVKALHPLFKKRGVHFIGSHPMAGSEQSGAEAALPDLYKNAVVFMTPLPGTPAQAVKTVGKLWKSAGAFTSVVDPKIHDAAVARTSHLPHLCAGLLVLNALDCPEKLSELRGLGCATGFRDTTRIASSSPAMWKEIIEFNSDELIMALREFRRKIENTESLLRKRNFAVIERQLEKSKKLRDDWLGNFRK